MYAREKKRDGKSVYIIFYSDSLEKQKDLIREEQVRVEIQVVR